MEKFKEGLLDFFAPTGKISKKLEVFYNPNKKFDRDLSVLLMEAFKTLYQTRTVCDLLAATGVRGLRFAKENKVKVWLNDANPKAYKLIKKNAKGLGVNISNREANLFLREYDNKFDYIDIDPFGSPNPFLHSAITKLVKKNGVLAITATDTAPLCGTYPKACIRKYQSTPLKTPYYNELGLRILVKKVITVGAEYEIALKPIFCHSTMHYFRAYFLSNSGAGRTDKLLSQIGLWQHDFATLKRRKYLLGEKRFGAVCGPLWLGKLWDEDLLKILPDTKFLKTIKSESRFGVGFYHLPTICSKLKKECPKMEKILSCLDGSRTHFNPQGLKTNVELSELFNFL